MIFRLFLIFLNQELQLRLRFTTLNKFSGPCVVPFLKHSTDLLCTCCDYFLCQIENFSSYKIWFDGKFWIVFDFFRYGETYDYSADGIEVAGNLDNGECGIIIRNVGFANSGTWKCELLRKQRPGSAVIGSEVTNAEIKLDVFRTSRLADDEGPVLQVTSNYQFKAKIAISPR